MAKIRKEYLVLFEDREGNRDVVGVFSSRKKALIAVRADARGRFPCTDGEDTPVVEFLGDTCRLFHGRINVGEYAVRSFVEDST